MGRFVVMVIDSFGIGAMADVVQDRPQDVGANTCLHVLTACPDLRLPHLTQLGLINALGQEVPHHAAVATACYGKSALAHYGADTFWGHQELMGSQPLQPLVAAFSTKLDAVDACLTAAGYRCERYGDALACLVVNGAVVIGDNLETDLGRVYNVSACLDQIDYADVVAIGRLVRSVVQVSRVIALGGKGVSLPQMLAAVETKQGHYCGVNAPKSGVYAQGYQVMHLGYGVDPSGQVPALLQKVGVPTKLCGKVADIVENTPLGDSIIGLVDTREVLEAALGQLDTLSDGFLCVNIQETDLAGHAQDKDKYAATLQIVDDYLPAFLARLNPEDVLIVTADHGNDPTVGHSQHTREYVPLLVHSARCRPQDFGQRSTLADIGATVCQFFDAPLPAMGKPIDFV